MNSSLTQQLSQWLTKQFGLICHELEEFCAVDTDLSLVYLGTAIATKLRLSLSRLETIAIAQQALQTFGSHCAQAALSHHSNDQESPQQLIPKYFRHAFDLPHWLHIEAYDHRTIEVRLDKHPWLSEILDGFIMHLAKAKQPQPAVVQIHDHGCTRFLIQDRQTPAIALPVKPAALQEAPLPQMKRALVVDDDPDVRQFCQLVLEQMGWQVDRVSDGQKALAQLYQADYQLVFLDGDMPNLNGSETARSIRMAEARSQKAAVTIFAMSARTTPDVVERALQAGCNLFLPKPLDSKLLQKSLAQFFPTTNRSKPAALDPMIAALLPQYLAKRATDLKTMTAALAVGDTHTMLRLAHKIKGSGRSYGLFDLSELAAMMEFHIKEGDLQATARDLQEMQTLLAQTQTDLPQLKQAQ